MNKITSIALGIATMLSSTLFAQQDTAHSNRLDEVVVTATKYPVKLSSTGKALTVITQQQIARSAGKDLAQLLNEQTGIVINGANSNTGKNKSIFIRGAKDTYTLILIDGIPASDVSLLSGGALDLRLVPLGSIERIEIVKGSQSSLYGSDAVAGVINIITKKGGDKKVAASAMASYGSYNTFNGNAGVHGSTKAVDYSVGYNYTNSDGFSEAKDTTGKGDFDKDGFNRNSFQSNFTFKVDKHLKLSPFYRYSYLKADIDSGAFTDNASKSTYLTNNAGLSAVYQLPKGNITANYSYLFAERGYPRAFIERYQAQFHNADAYMNYALSSQVQLLTGIAYQEYGMYDNEVKSEVTMISPYASLFIQSGTGLNVEIGGRYNNHSKFGQFSTYSINTSYNVAPYWKFFANVSTGFKVPSLSQLLWAANPDLKPETSDNLEGGFQINTAHQKINLTATAFVRKIDNIIEWVNTGYTNVDKQNDHGVELEATIKPVEHLDIKASYTYITGKITQRREGKDTTFPKLLKVPQNRWTVAAGYEANKKLYFSTSLETIGKREDQFYSLSTDQTKSVNLDAYALVNVYGEYRLCNGRYKIFMDAKNITNAKYYEAYGYSVQGFNITGGVSVTL